MILTHSLKYDLKYVKGFSDIYSKSIEHQQKKGGNRGYIDELRSGAPAI